jgi:hypothetical protein
MVNLFLMSEHPRNWLRPFGRLPEIHREIVTCRDKPLDNFSLYGSCFRKPFLSLRELSLV